MNALQSIVESLVTDPTQDSIIEMALSQRGDDADVARQLAKEYGGAAKARAAIKKAMKDPGSKIDGNRALRLMKTLKSMTEGLEKSQMTPDGSLIRSIEKAALAYAKKNAPSAYEFLRGRDGKKAAKGVRAVVARAQKNPKFNDHMKNNRDRVISELGQHYVMSLGKSEGYSFGEMAAAEAVARETFEANEEDALADFTAEIQRRAKDDQASNNFATRQGVHESMQIPETPDQLWESVNALVPNMLRESRITEMKDLGTEASLTEMSMSTFLHAYDGKKLMMFQVLKTTKSSVVVRQVATSGKVKKSTKVVPQKGSFVSAKPVTIRLKGGQVTHPHFGKLSKWNGKPMAPMMESVSDNTSLLEEDENRRHGGLGNLNTPDAIFESCVDQGTMNHLDEAKTNWKKGARSFEDALVQLRKAILAGDRKWIENHKKSAGFYNPGSGSGHGEKKIAMTIKRAEAEKSMDKVSFRSLKPGAKFAANASAVFRVRSHLVKVDDKTIKFHDGKEGSARSFVGDDGMVFVVKQFRQESYLDEAKGDRPDPTVDTFLTVLASKITQADMRAEKASEKRGSHFNHNALALYFGAMQDRVEKPMKGKENSSEPADLKRLKALIDRAFTQFSPANFTMKAIDKWLTSGTWPKISGRAGTSPAWPADRRGT